MNLGTAIDAHVKWKMKFRNAIANRETMDAPENIKADNYCPLGQWLHGEGRAQFGSMPEFDVVLEKHKQFHLEAFKICRLINTRQYAEAEACLGPASAYMEASNETCEAIVQLQTALKLMRSQA